MAQFDLKSVIKKKALAVSSAASFEERLSLMGVSLKGGERVLAVSEVHPAIYWKSGALFVLACFLSFTFLQNLSWFLFVVAGVMFVLGYLTRHSLILCLTNKRILLRMGVFYADVIALRFEQTESVEAGMTPLGQVFNYGSLVITGTGQRRLIVPFITDVISFKNKINEVMLDSSEG